MDFYSLSDAKIAAELGQRIWRLRQRRGYSKESLALAVGVDATAIALLEKGKCDLFLFVAVLRELRAFGQLERFLKESRVKALELTDPELPSEGTVMYRRRRADFKVYRATTELVSNPKRSSDFPKAEAENVSTKADRKSDFSGQ
jgi:transcriptional regulator with XRE-family HTH domain